MQAAAQPVAVAHLMTARKRLKIEGLGVRPGRFRPRVVAGEGAGYVT